MTAGLVDLRQMLPHPQDLPGGKARQGGVRGDGDEFLRAHSPVSYTHLDVYKRQRQYRLDCPDREREFFHLVPDTLPCLLDGSAKIQRDTERIGSSLVKRFLRHCHLYDVLILIAWIRCDLQRDDFIHHVFELVQIHDIVGESVTPAV